MALFVYKYHGNMYQWNPFKFHVSLTGESTRHERQYGPSCSSDIPSEVTAALESLQHSTYQFCY